MKYPKSMILILLVILIFTLNPLYSSAASIFSYDVNIDVQQGGQLYFNYGKNGKFFLLEDWESYPEDCQVRSNQQYSFTKLLDRGCIPVPEDGYYFNGFYLPNGKKAPLEETKLDILRVSVEGFYFYNCFPSKENKAYRRLTKTAYQNQVKLYLKGLYGTTRYKVMDTVTIYELPKSNSSYTARFSKKTQPNVTLPEAVTKVYGNAAFYITSQIPKDLNCSFKTSSTKVLTVNKTTGYVTLKGPGTANVTCTIKETETTLPSSYITTVTVKPAKVKQITAKRTKKTLSVQWSSNSKNSGYEIQVSNNTSFQNIIAKKTITGGKTNKTTVKLKSEVCNNYVRIRPYKTSKGEKIYNQYTVAPIQ